MARARNIKPAFFKNEELVELSYDRRLLFIGLWMLADRLGRLEDRPKRIKMEIFPGDDVPVEKALDDLHRAGFITRYKVGEEAFIQVCEFLKHQNPHHREPPSTIPPLGSNASKPEALPTCQVPQSLGLDGDGSAAEPRASPGPASGEPQPSPSLAVLNPDSGFLNPESREKTTGAGAPVVPADLVGDPVAGNAEWKIPDCPHEKIIALYHELCPTLNRVKSWNGERPAYARCRWRETFERLRDLRTEADGLDWFADFFRAVSGSDLLTGNRPSKEPGKAPWQADLVWLLRPENFAKAIEGRYWAKQ